MLEGKEPLREAIGCLLIGGDVRKGNGPFLDVLADECGNAQRCA